MRNITFLPIISCAALVACGQASAKTPDPQNDLHCHVLNFYYMGVAKQNGTDDQQRSFKVMHQWYSAKMHERMEQLNKSMEEVLAPGEQLLDAVKRNPASMMDTSLACAKRSTQDPSFDGFVRAL